MHDISSVISDVNIALKDEEPKQAGVLLEGADAKEYNRAYNQSDCDKNAHPSPVIIAKTVKQLRSVINVAAQNNISLVCQAGKTSLTYGATPEEGEACLILCSDIQGRKVSQQRSCPSIVFGTRPTIEELQNEALSQQLVLPLQYGSKGSAKGVGALATNAGGSDRTVDGLVQHIKMIDGLGNEHYFQRPDDQSLITDSALPASSMPPLGSQGIFGYITEGSLTLETPFAEQFTALFGFDSLEQLYEASQILQCNKDEQLQLGQVELMNRQAVHFSLKHTGLSDPLDRVYDYYLYVRIDAKEIGLQDKALARFMSCLQGDESVGCVVAESLQQAQDLLAIREEISDANRTMAKQQGGVVVSHDLGFPGNALCRFLPAANEITQTIWGGKVTTFGHMNQRPGQIGQHYNPILGVDKPDTSGPLSQLSTRIFEQYCKFFPQYSRQDPGNLEQFMVWMVHHFRNISLHKQDQQSEAQRWTHVLEHGGLGRKTVAFTAMYVDWQRIKDVCALKTLYDPKGVFNKGVWNTFIETLYHRIEAEHAACVLTDKQAGEYRDFVASANVNHRQGY